MISKQKKILIISKRSLLSDYLFKELRKNFKVKIVNYDFIKKIKKLNYDIIINCKLEKKFLIQKINDSYFEINLIKKLTKKNVYIFLSSSKILRVKKDYYTKNKIYIEKKVKFYSKKNEFKFIILRISNIVFNYTHVRNNLLVSTIQRMTNSLKEKNLIYLPIKKIYKDFIAVNDLTKIIYKLLRKKIYGTFNLGSGFKYNMKDIASKLIKSYGGGHIIYNKNINTDSFVLNSKKIQKLVNYKINKQTVYNLIKKIGKNIK